MKAIEKRRAAAGQSGFTLIELLVVIAILGILAGVVVFAVGNTTDNAKEKACKLEKRSLKTALEAWKGNDGSDGLGGASDANGYPTDVNFLFADTVDPDGAGPLAVAPNKSKFLQEAFDAASFVFAVDGGGNLTGSVEPTTGGKWTADIVALCDSDPLTVP